MRIFILFLTMALMFSAPPRALAQNNIFVSPNTASSKQGDSSIYNKSAQSSSARKPVFNRGQTGSPVLFNRIHRLNNTRRTQAQRSAGQQELQAMLQAGQAKQLERINARSEAMRRELARDQKAYERARAARTAHAKAEHAKLVAADRAASQAALLGAQVNVTPGAASTEGGKTATGQPQSSVRQIYKREERSFSPRSVFNPYE